MEMFGIQPLCWVSAEVLPARMPDLAKKGRAFLCHWPITSETGDTSRELADAYGLPRVLGHHRELMEWRPSRQGALEAWLSRFEATIAPQKQGRLTVGCDFETIQDLRNVRRWGTYRAKPQVVVGSIENHALRVSSQVVVEIEYCCTRYATDGR